MAHIPNSTFARNVRSCEVTILKLLDFWQRTGLAKSKQHIQAANTRCISPQFSEMVSCGIDMPRLSPGAVLDVEHTT